MIRVVKMIRLVRVFSKNEQVVQGGQYDQDGGVVSKYEQGSQDGQDGQDGEDDQDDTC